MVVVPCSARVGEARAGQGLSQIALQESDVPRRQGYKRAFSNGWRKALAVPFVLTMKFSREPAT